MRFLIDTNGWIGFFEGRRDFGAAAKAAILAHPGDCCVSVASIWEAAIKARLGKLKLPYDLGRDLPRLLDENGFEVLGLEIGDVVATKDLESLHGDPFDRIQVIQARRRGLGVISRDPVFEQYGILRIWR